MKTFFLKLAAVSLLTLNATAATRYVDLNSTNPVSPYNSWATAATNIQQAAAIAGGGDTVLVTNGVYQYGSASGARVYVGNNATVQSVNGPTVTVIQGYQVPGTTNGPSAIRCVYLNSGATLSGFTLTNGATVAGDNGGGVKCAAANCIVSNCVITGNASVGAYSGKLIACVLSGNVSGWGGGAYNSILVNCTLTGNSSGYRGGGAAYSSLTNCLLTGNYADAYGGGTDGSTVVNCTVASNTAKYYGGGVEGGTVENSIIYYNHQLIANTGSTNYHSLSAIANCCTTPLPGFGANNITNPPLFVNLAGGDFHLQKQSPCVNAGSNSFVAGLNIDLDGNPRVVGNSVDIGAYEHQSPGSAMLYVDAGNASPLSPFLTWATAATNIQDAIDAAMPGDEVVVTNGLYQTGGRAVGPGSTPNRVLVNKAVTVRTVNGPAVTTILGSTGPSRRCVYLTNGAALFGFTLTGGGTFGSGDAAKEQSGGGVWSASSNVIVSNCVISFNVSANIGGGAYGGTLLNCAVERNQVSNGNGGGTASNVLINCVIYRNGASRGGGAIGCSLSNCTVTNNSAANDGGGVYGCTLNNSVVITNLAPRGGGIYGGVANNCLILNNRSFNGGGGAYGGLLNNCVIAGNECLYQPSGGAGGGVLNNCIVYFNRSPASGGENFSNCTMNACCTIPLPETGTGNFTNDPAFVDFANLNFQLQPGSFCINAGNNSYATNALDLGGNPRIFGPYADVGAYEYQAAAPVPLSVAIQVPYTKVPTGFVLNLLGQIAGHEANSVWDFGDGTVVSNQPSLTHSWNLPGDYPIVFMTQNGDNPGGISATVTVQVVTALVYYADANGTNPIPPYISWETAALTIQDAIDSAPPTATVLVTNGTYAVGGRVMFGSLTNRVSVDKPLTVQSVNGPAVTIISGNPVLDTNAVRCVYLTNNVTLLGFTLTSGATLASGDGTRETSGGALWCVSTNSSVVSNCVLTASLAANNGGGVYGGRLINCFITTNSAGNDGGGAERSVLFGCTLSGNTAGGWGGGIENCSASNCVFTGNSARTAGASVDSDVVHSSMIGNVASEVGGAVYRGTITDCSLTQNSAGGGGAVYYSMLNNCTFTSNSAAGGAGAVAWSTLNNCLLVGNSAGVEGGGTDYSTLNNCTLIGNWATNSAGGSIRSTLSNCILFQNFAPVDPEFSSDSALNYCRTTDLATNGVGNITNDPVFVDLVAGNFRLQTNSPCVNAGSNTNAASATDLDGRPRIVGGTVDMGAYEFQGAGIGEFIAWLQQFNLPVNGSADFTDTDGDGLNNWQEWIAGTIPTNAASVLIMGVPSNDVSGVTITWQSVSGKSYFLQRALDLSIQPAFSVLQSNILGQAGTTTYSDATATNGGPYFYRVGVQP